MGANQISAEEQARNLLARLGIGPTRYYSAGDLVELANLIAERDHLRRRVMEAEARPPGDSQSIRSDRISASTIARIAGNLLSGRTPSLSMSSDKKAVKWAVQMAREIAAEVERTTPVTSGPIERLPARQPDRLG
jgi:hypothetical protein